MASVTKTKPIPLGIPNGIKPNITRVASTIRNHITFPAIGRTDPNVILEGCVALSCFNASISGFGKMYRGLPSHTTCLNTLHQLDLEELMGQSSAILAEPAMKVLKKGRSYSFAIDKTDIPYYGDREGRYAPYVVGGKRKASTNYFYAYMTISVVDKNNHFTLAVIPWTKETKNLSGIQQCVDTIHALGLKIKCLTLDREFYATPIFRYLQNMRIPHIVPVKVNCDILRNQLKGRKSKSFEYLLNSGKKDEKLITIYDCVGYHKGIKEKHGTIHHPFVVFRVPLSSRKIREIYSHRFSIESSYRMCNLTKAKTTSKDPVIRLFYTLISFLYQNCWIVIQHKRFRKLQPGPIVIQSELFRLEHFAALIHSEIMETFSIRRIEDIAIA